MNVFFFGLGFSSRAAAKSIQALKGAEAQIAGTTRSAAKADALRADNIVPYLFDDAQSEATLAVGLAQATHVVHSIAPTEDGDAVLTHHLADLQQSKNLQWLCYYSTVGVYGNFDGAWIDENADCRPLNKRSQWRVSAEQKWRDFAAEKDVPLLVLRLAGIYGPGRSSFDKLASGKARRIIKPGQVFNRIHVADIGRVTALAAEQKLNGTFNLTDDMPAPPQDLITHAAEMLCIAPPPAVPFEEADMSPMARSFYSDNKRVSNAAIKKALGIDLLYPTYHEGLADIYRNRA